jgi:hypothetical protein
MGAEIPLRAAVTSSAAPQPPSVGTKGNIHRGKQDRDMELTTHSVSKVRNVWSYTPMFPIHLHDIMFSHKDYFILELVKQ